MPTLDQFIESLMHEQYKVISMGTKGPNVHALDVHENKNTSTPNSKLKGKGKVHSEPKKEGHSKPLDDTSSSKGGKGKKGKSKCGDCNRGFHPKSSCMKKTSNLMAKLLQQNNLGDCNPEDAKKLEDQLPNER